MPTHACTHTARLHGAFLDEVLDADFVSARARMATMKSAMLIEAPLLVNNKRRHPTGCSYHQAYNKALSKHHEMEAREGKFARQSRHLFCRSRKGWQPCKQCLMTTNWANSAWT